MEAFGAAPHATSRWQLVAAVEVGRGNGGIHAVLFAIYSLVGDLNYFLISWGSPN